MKSRGADAAFDYKDPDCVKQINKFTDNNLKYVWDTISLPASAKICAEAISPGGIYGTLVGVEFPRTDVRKTFSLGYTAIGEPIEKRGNKFDKPEDLDFMKKWVSDVEPLIEEGKIQVHPAQVGNGLENVLEGIDLLRQNKVHGHKLVYTL